ncbi:flagellin FliC, partial [Shigella sonnei]
ADVETYFGTGNVQDTKDTTDATGTAGTKVYQVQVEGQTYFVGQDNNTNTNGFTLLKQNSTGYEKVQVGGKDVQLANFGGRVTAFVED